MINEYIIYHIRLSKKRIFPRKGCRQIKPGSRKIKRTNRKVQRGNSFLGQDNLISRRKI